MRSVDAEVLHRELVMSRIAADWEPLRTQVLEHRAQLALSLRVTIAALLSFTLSHLLHVPLPLWTVLTAVILTQASFGRSLKATKPRGALPELFGGLLGSFAFVDGFDFAKSRLFGSYLVDGPGGWLWRLF